MPFCRVSLKAARPSKILQNPHTSGDHIKKRRLELGLFQKDFAQTLGVDESTITNWEKNHTNPMLRLLPKIIEFLGYEPSVGNRDTLGGKLLRYRKSRGVTQKELAKQIVIDPTTLSRIERGKGKCFPSILERVIAFLNRRASNEDISQA